MRGLMIPMVVLMVALLAAGMLAGCGGGDGQGSAAVTGPTNPNVVVACLQDGGPGQGSGNTTINTTVDCGDRSSHAGVEGQ